MKLTITKKKLAVVAVGIFAGLALLASGGATRAIGEGQIERGDIYRIKNITKNSAFSDPAGADKCETVQYKVRLHNPGVGTVTNVNVKATLPSGASTTNVSTVTVSAQNAFPAVVSDTATLLLSSPETVSYVPGSTQLLNTSNALIQNLPDGILTNGVNIGNVGVSLNNIEFVQFQAKINCPPPPVTPVFTCDLFDIKSNPADRSVSVTNFKVTALNGAVFNNAVINWGDGSAPLTTANPIGQTHQFATDGPFTITATAHFTVNGQDVTATSTACKKQVKFIPQPPEKPVFTCDLLDVKADNATRTVTVTAFQVTALNGAVFNNAVINWGDSSTPLTSANPVGQTHQYAADGTFTITATAHFTVNGQDVTATSTACKKQVKFVNQPPENPVFSCDKFNVKAEDNRMVKTTEFAVTAKNGAVFKNAVINWGDNTPSTTANSVNGVIGQTHQYATDGTFTITVTAHFTVNGQDQAATGPQCQKIVKFQPNKPPEVPEFTCDKFKIQAQENRTVKVTDFAVTAKNGAKFANAVIDWGDGSTPLTTNNVVGQTHQFGRDDTFVISVTAHFTVDGKDVTAGSVNCQEQVTFRPNVPPVVTPPTVTPPSTLVNTGPGENLAALFAATTAIGMIVYRRLLARSLRG